MKAFLSHSSKQKTFVETVAKNLSDIAIIDSKSFEAGLENKDEIISNIDRCDIFVIFLSEEALESTWVKLELDYAKNRLDEGKLKRIYPIIIDEKINHNDTRIPSWLKNNYNLKHIARTGKASHLIKRRIQELVWDQHPIIKQRDEVFVGRNNLIQNLEERLDDIQKESPSILIASGLPKIGRKTLVKKALVKTSSIRNSYIFPSIFLDARESIEDFIVKVYDLGFSEDISFPDLINSTLDEKIQICCRLINDIQTIQEILLIEDNGCIILHDRSVSNWLYKILQDWNKYGLHQKITIVIISQYKPKPSLTVGYNDIYNVEVSELNKKEKIGLLKRLCEVYKITNVPPNDIIEITTRLNGFPNQIHYCVDLLKSTDLSYLRKNFSLLEGYQKEVFNRIIIKIENDPIYKETLELLVEFDFISIELLIEILPDSYNVHSIIENLDGGSIIEKIGTNKEYLRLNQGIKDYLQRAGYKISPKYKEKLKRHIERYLDSLPTNKIGNDVSDFFYSLKGALLGNYKFQNKFLLPSHYLKTMISLYEQNKNYKDVILLADRILEREEKLDAGIKHEIKYWLCLALARTKNERLKTEVQFFEGADKSFLLGFYYRINGQADFALEKFYDALKERPRFSRAQREIVTVLNNLGLHDEALDYAEINYENENNNPFHIQAYFDCLIRKPSYQRQSEKITQLLDELKAINTNKAKEMAAIAQADYELFINKNSIKALSILSKSLEDQPSSAYLLNKKFTIHERDSNLSDMEQTMKKYEKVTQSRNNWNESNQLMIMQAKIHAYKGDKNKAFNIVSRLNHVPDRTKQHLLVTLNAV